LDGERGAGDRTAKRSLSVLCVAVYLAVVVVLFVAICHRDDGVFTYTLDDPYIHLALAQSLAHGHYGINPGEASSPSSSIVWPFLLVPFALSVGGEYAPLVWNVVFCAIAAWLIGWTVERWAWRAVPSFLVRLAIALTLVLVANLPGLTFVGMEHGLQVLLAIACAAGLAEAFAGRPIPAWCLIAAVLGPAVRYENFALVAAVAIALYGQRRRVAAWTVVAASLVVPVLFSGFLLSRGLPALPSSVLVKARVYAGNGGPITTAFGTLAQSLIWGIQQPAWWNQLLVAILLAFLMLREKRRAVRMLLAAGVTAALLQLLAGRVNWFHRYEVYAFAFTVMLAATALVESTDLQPQILLAGLVALSWPYALAAWQTPEAATEVYQQQFQMHRFLANFGGRAVAVNDLGLVSYSRPRNLYVLDLWGLASPEASRQRNKDAAWLEDITAKRDAGLAIVYPDWYPEGGPDEWDPLATMCIAVRRPVAIADRCVVFYSTDRASTAALQAEVSAFARTLPAGVKMTLGQDTTEVDEDHPK
jgi:hypothetical protein